MWRPLDSSILYHETQTLGAEPQPHGPVNPSLRASSGESSTKLSMLGRPTCQRSVGAFSSGFSLKPPGASSAKSGNS